MDFVNILFRDGSNRMIHKGWQPRKTAPFESATQSDTKVDALSPRCSKTLATETSYASEPQLQKRWHRKYKFINSKNPQKKRGPEILNDIRSHVRKEFIRAAKQGKAVTKTDPLITNPKRNFESVSASDGSLNIPCFLVQPTYFSEYPIEMHSHTHALLSSYLTYGSSRIYPVGSSLKSNPLKSPEWFHFAVTDAAMLHAILYAAAMYLALLEGRPESKETIYHQTQTISIIQERLNASNQQFDDSTLGAISCLAIGGAISGNVKLWHIHMKGLKQMIHKRGNFSSLSTLLQAKLRRSDVTGAIDYGLPPYLDLRPSPTPPIWSILTPSTLSQTSTSMACILSPRQIHPSLIQTLTFLSLFAQTLKLASSNPTVTISPEAFSNDLYTLEHNLLAFPSTLPSPGYESALSVSLRSSALIYLKSVLQEFPHSVNGSRILVERLRTSLNLVSVGEEQGEEEERKRMVLVAWMCIVGAAVARGGVREWFIMKLGRIEVCCAIGEETEMERLLSLRSVFDKRCLEKIWEGVEMLSKNRSLL